MRLTRSQTKRAAKMRYIRHQKLRSTDGPQCPHCEPHINASLNKATAAGRRAQVEINDALSANMA